MAGNKAIFVELDQMGIPCFKGIPCGHGPIQRVIPFATKAQVIGGKSARIEIASGILC